ncbi:MAG: helix-turn-helix transcriptional regulator [Bacteroidetes bacterium]|nr:helix-turn-helix transcriptional regulator [Bacteroidota bacterium]
MPRIKHKNDEFAAEIGNRIRVRLVEIKKDSVWLAETVGVNRNTVYRWQKGEIPLHTLNLPAVAKALNVSIAYLVGEGEPPTRDPVFLVVEKNGVEQIRIRIEQDVEIRIEGEAAK